MDGAPHTPPCMAQEHPGVARLARLDGLRGLAACTVAFAYHAKLLFGPTVAPPAPLAPVIGWFTTWGWTFVDLFFVLSGFIFAHVYLSGRGLADRRDLADFAVARFARLYPLHLFMLLAVAVFAFGEGANTAPAFAAHLVMGQAFVLPFAESFDGPSWSLSIECLCYVIFAVAAMGGRRVLGWVTALAVAWGAAMLALHGKPDGPWVADVFPRGLLGFFMGQALWHMRGPLARVPGWVLAGLVAFGVLVPTASLSPLLPLLLAAWPAALLLALRLPAFEHPVMIWLGDRSYGIYLIHMPALLAAKALAGPFEGPHWGAALVWAGFVATVLLASEASFRLIENPARRAIRKTWRNAVRRRGAARAQTA